MTDLTEYTWYYCKMKDGDIQMLERGSDYFLSGDVPLLNNEVKEVLAEVPSYEEWKKAYECVVSENEEITTLKELLKECQGSIATLLSKRITEVNGIKQKELLAKINQALGEDK